jgi:SAM-dependent methyltransferase
MRSWRNKPSIAGAAGSLSFRFRSQKSFNGGLVTHVERNPELSEKGLHAPCPNCGAQEINIFYTVTNVPVHSCLLLSTPEEALRFPTGDIALGLCRGCGFIANAAYSDAQQNYSPPYEDQQCFSPTFNVFAKELAQRLIAKYDLHEKTILEIGCGKGDFLLLMCESGNNRGIGIDPAIAMERIRNETAKHVQFVREFYSEHHANLHADFIMCRHTLEHISQTRSFVQTVRRAIGKRLETTVFFEVPETMRVLREFAFWDIYYEHCSYFTPGSLARLFRACGFEILNLAKEFDEQYLLVEAEPAGNHSSSRIHPLEESVATMADTVKVFAKTCAERREQWRARLRREHEAGKRIAIWGSGSKCVSFLTTLQLQNEIGAIVDINPHRHGKFLPRLGKKISPLQSLQGFQPDLVLVMNPIYSSEIRRMLQDMKVGAEVICV